MHSFGLLKIEAHIELKMLIGAGGPPMTCTPLCTSREPGPFPKAKQRYEATAAGSMKLANWRSSDLISPLRQLCAAASSIG